MATSLPPSTSRIRPAMGRRLLADRSRAELYEDALRAGEGVLAASGPLVVRTGKHTGRSPGDKFIVREPSSESKIWWGPFNQANLRGALRSAPDSARGTRRRA